MRRCLGVIVIVAALLASVFTARQARKELTTLEIAQQGGSMLDVLPDWLEIPVSDFDPGRGIEYPESWVLTRAAKSVSVPAAAADVRLLAEKTPNPPRGDLWNWWRLTVSSGMREPAVRYIADPVTRRSAALPPEADSAPKNTPAEPAPTVNAENDAAWDATLDYLRAADPDNGWPMFLSAARDLRRSVREYTMDIPDVNESTGQRTVTRYEVMPADVALSARAAREAHAAAKAPRFDQAMDDLARTEFDRLGGRPATLAHAIRDIGVYAGILLPHLQIVRGEARSMMAEAERRAGLNPGEIDDGLDAYQVLDDQLTLGARFMESENTLVSMLVGVAVQAIVAEEGDRILRDAGRPDDAERLVARARLLVRPMALNNARVHLM